MVGVLQSLAKLVPVDSHQQPAGNVEGAVRGGKPSFKLLWSKSGCADRRRRAMGCGIYGACRETVTRSWIKRVVLR